MGPNQFSHLHHLPGKACPQVYVPDQRSVSRSLVGTDSSNTSLEGFKRGCCCHGHRQVVPAICRIVLGEKLCWMKVLVSDGRIKELE